jgi:hypothetical protein
MPSAFILAVLILSILAGGCKKSERDIAEEKAINRHEQDVGSHPMLSHAAWSNYLQTPAGKQAMIAFSALDFLKSCKTNGQLPGVSKDTKGMFRSEKKPSDLTTDGSCSMEIHFFTRDQPQQQDYYYIIARASSNSTWQFNKAWQTDHSGKVIQEYPVQ